MTTDPLPTLTLNIVLLVSIIVLLHQVVYASARMQVSKYCSRAGLNRAIFDNTDNLRVNDRVLLTLPHSSKTAALITAPTYFIDEGLAGLASHVTEAPSILAPSVTVKYDNTVLSRVGPLPNLLDEPQAHDPDYDHDLMQQNQFDQMYTDSAPTLHGKSVGEVYDSLF